MSWHEERPTLADEIGELHCPACECRVWEPLRIDVRRLGSETPEVCDECLSEPGEACQCCGRLADRLVVEDRFNCAPTHVCGACYAEAVQEGAEVAA